MTHVPQHNSLLFYLLIINNAPWVDTLFLPARLYRTNRLLRYVLLEFDRFEPLPCVITVMEHEGSLASLQKLTICSCSESLSQYVCVVWCVCVWCACVRAWCVCVCVVGVVCVFVCNATIVTLMYS